MSNTFIYEATSAYGTALPTQRKLFRVNNGEFAGRLFALFSRTPSTVSYAVADPPYTEWSTPIDIVTDAADYPVGGFIDSSDCLFMVYTKQTSHDLAVVKLTYSAGSWSVGTTHTIYNGDDNYFPTIYKDSDQTLYVTWSRYAGGQYTINVKLSVDEGQTWGAGPSDAGTTLSATGSSAYSALTYRSSYVYCIYALGGTKLAYRRKDINAGTWETEETIYTGSGLYDDFQVAVSTDNRLGVAFSTSGNLYYKEHNGTSWSGLYTVDNDPGLSPHVRFVGSTPYVFFGRTLGTNQKHWVYSRLEQGDFSDPEGLLAGFGSFDVMQCYDASSGAPTYDRTAQAADAVVADVYHPDSGKLMDVVGDGIYLGMENRFCRVAVILSTLGAGGSVAWSYWNGTSWVTFTPASGAYHFDSSPACVRLWDDIQSTPAGWQKLMKSTQFKFWVRAMVSAAFTAGPVGSQLTAMTDLADAVSTSG
ncbi:hypothetical protein ACFLQW_03275 [Candidatus Zixiibacteriota bacterium]